MKIDLPGLNNVSQVEKLLFTKHIGIMLKSGITLTEAVGILKAQTRPGPFRNVLQGIGEGLINGQTLEKSLARYPKVFDSLFRSIVAIGEGSGTLEGNLIYLSGQLKRTYDFQRKVASAMLYPSIVFTTMTIAGGGIALFVLPQLVDLFSSMEVALPISTRILLGVSVVAKLYGIWIVAAVALGLVAGRFLIKSSFFKPRWQRFMLHWPVLGPLLRQIEMAQFCRNLGVMLKSGLPIAQALAACAQASKNVVYRDYIQSLTAAVERGQAMEKELSSNKYPLVPIMVTKMIGVGEQSGKLDEVLLYLADFFEEEVDASAKNLEVVLEPILLFVIALGVAFFALSVISPIYKFTGSVGR